MREVVIAIHCDVCNEAFAEKTEGSNRVLFTVYGEQREMDICDADINGTFLQEARPVKTRKIRKKDQVCHCGRAYTTLRGLSAHQTRAHK